MPGPSIELEMRLRGQTLQVGLDKAAQSEQRMESGLEKIGKTAKQAERELERFAKQTERINASPLEKYHSQLGRLQQALERGKISQETYRRAVDRAGQSFLDANRAQGGVIGPTVLDQLRQAALGYLTLSRAVNVFGDALRHGKQQSDDAKNSLLSLDDERRKLAQLAIDMPAGSLAKMQERSDNAARAASVDRATAMSTLFTAHSFGFQDQFEDVMRMNPIIDVKAAAQLTGKVRTMMGAKHLTPSQIVSMAIEAGQPSEVDAETIAGAMAQAAEGGRRIGATPEETMGLLSALTTYFAGRGEGGEEGNIGAARVTGQRMRTFGHKVAQRLPDMPQQGFVAAFRHVQGMHPLDREKFLQENEELGGLYAAMGEALPQAEKVIADVTRARDAAPGTSNVDLGLAIRGRDPLSAGSLANKRAELNKEIERDRQLGLQELARQAAAENARASGSRTGLGILQSYALSSFMNGAMFFRANPRHTTAIGGMGVQVAGQLTGDAATGNSGLFSFFGNLLSQQVAEARLQSELLQEISNNTQNRPSPGAAAAAPLN